MFRKYFAKKVCLYCYLMMGHIALGCIANFFCDNIAIQIALKRQKKVKFDPSLHLILSVQRYKQFSNWQNLFYDTPLNKVIEKQRKTILFKAL